MLAGGDPSTMSEFFHSHLNLGALGYVKTFLFYCSWGFFQKKKTHHGQITFSAYYAKITSYTYHICVPVLNDNMFLIIFKEDLGGPNHHAWLYYTTPMYEEGEPRHLKLSVHS